ncbi:MAG: hypothetical protein CSA26_02390 [Desulfobacterales bacterium]|nr:MAG: hypothetical protein CSA26_02390 [Desulfobacterales bacterium]
MKKTLIFSLLLAIGTFCTSSPWAATAEELKKVGQEWQEIERLWTQEKARHQERSGAIERSNLPENQRKILQKKELNRHKKRSRKLARRRNSVHNKIIAETNARLGKSGSIQAPLTKTAGTKVHQKGHRGMAGDLDLGGSPVAAKKMREVMADMGIDVPVSEHAGTISFGDGSGFELTINKGGLTATPGSEFHKIQVEVDAANPETYLSESMKQRDARGKVVKKNAGADYVEIQDHRRKALKGHTASNTELTRKGNKYMQPMAKGTKKVLDMGVLDDKTVRKILDTNGMEDLSVKDFKEMLNKVKTGDIEIKGKAKAAQLREASKDIFSVAEKKAFQKKQKEIARLRKDIADLPSNSPKRKALKDELIDSLERINTSKKVNDDIFSGKRQPEPEIHRNPKNVATAKKAPQTFDSDIKQITRGGLQRTVDRTVIKAVGHKGAKTIKQVTRRGLKRTVDRAVIKAFGYKGAKRIKVAGKVLGGVMQIADIGNTCKLIQEYREGKRHLSDVVKTLIDIPLGGAISTGETLGTKYRDWTETKDAINDANKNNMKAFLQQWEIILRKSGLSKEEARKYVATAVELGNLNVLERKADELRAQGKKITSPELIIETYESDDTLWQRTKAVGTGMVQGVWDGTKYIVTAPYRVVTSWNEKNFAENELYKDLARANRMKVTLYRKLRRAGVSSKRALAAVNDWEKGKFAKLREIVREKRKGKFVSVRRHQKDWYCTNRPEIRSDAAMTEMINEEIDRRNKINSFFGLPQMEKLQ